MNEQVQSPPGQVEEVVADESQSESMIVSSGNDPNEPVCPVTPSNNDQISPNNSEQSQSAADNYAHNEPDNTIAPAPTSNYNTAQTPSQSQSDIDTPTSAPTPAPSPSNDDNDNDNDKKPITDYTTSAPPYQEPSRHFAF